MESAVMTASRRAHGRGWESLRLFFGALLLALCVAAPNLAGAGETGSVDEYAGVHVMNSVLLDPFDPVPQIEFEHRCGWGCHRHCDDYRCGEGWRCRHDCRWNGWHCDEDCYGHRPCDHDCGIGWWRCEGDCRTGEWRCDHDCHLLGWYCEHDCLVHPPCERDCHDRFGPPCDHERDCRPEEHCTDACYGRLVHDYEEIIQRSDDQAHRYDEQSRWYFEHVMDDHHHDGFDHDHHDGYDHGHDHDGYGPSAPPGPGPYGPPSHGPGPYGPPGSGPGPSAYGPSGPGPGSYGPSGPPPGGPGPGPGPGGPGPGAYGPSGPPPAGPGPGSFGPPGGPSPGSGPSSSGPSGPPPGPGSGPPPGPPPGH